MKSATNNILSRWSSLFAMSTLSVSFANASLFDLGILKKPLFSRIRCTIAYLRFGYTISEFDKYGTYFRDDSVVHLAQAGTYVGAENIEEYIKFIYSEFSPYLRQDDPDNIQSIRIQGFDSDTGQCEFTATNLFGYFMDPAFTSGIPDFDAISMAKVFYDLEEGYITRINGWYPEDFLRVFFGVGLNSDTTRRYVCDEVITGPCSGIIDATDDCEVSFEMLPIAEGESNWVDGNSQGCRFLHAAFAKENPELHCPHLSFTPMADSNGLFKCQESAGVLPSELFRDQDFKNYRRFARKNGVDPELGHTSSM